MVVAYGADRGREGETYNYKVERRRKGLLPLLLSHATTPHAEKEREREAAEFPATQKDRCFLKTLWEQLLSA